MLHLMSIKYADIGMYNDNIYTYIVIEKLIRLIRILKQKIDMVSS